MTKGDEYMSEGVSAEIVPLDECFYLKNKNKDQSLAKVDEPLSARVFTGINPLTEWFYLKTKNEV